jgi:hypothetical protein
MKRIALIAPALALLAACSGGADQIQPGMWETTSEMVDIELPGLPEEAVAQMKARFTGQTQTQSQCITPEQAANPVESMLNQNGGEQGCTFSETVFANGTINVRGTCPGPAGAGSAAMSWQGSYTADTMEGRFTAEFEAAPGSEGAAGGMRMSGTLKSRRTGDCPASAS